MRAPLLASLAALVVFSGPLFAQEPSVSPTGTTPPVAGAPPASTDPVPTDKKGSKVPADKKGSAGSIAEARKTDSIPSPGEAMDPHIKKGSEDDVDAVGTRNIGGRGPVL